MGHVVCGGGRFPGSTTARQVHDTRAQHDQDVYQDACQKRLLCADCLPDSKFVEGWKMAKKSGSTMNDVRRWARVEDAVWQAIVNDLGRPASLQQWVALRPESVKESIDRIIVDGSCLKEVEKLNISIFYAAGCLIFDRPPRDLLQIED